MRYSLKCCKSSLRIRLFFIGSWQGNIFRDEMKGEKQTISKKTPWRACCVIRSLARIEYLVMELPAEIWIYIFRFCSVKQLHQSIFLLSKWYYQLFQNDIVWNSKLEDLRQGTAQTLHSFFHQNSSLSSLFSLPQQCRLLEIAKNLKQCNSTQNSRLLPARNSVFVGMEGVQRSFIVQQMFRHLFPSLTRKNCNIGCIGTDFLSEIVTCDEKNYYLVYFVSEVYGARFQPYTGIFKGQSVVVIFFDAFYKYNRLEKQRDSWSSSGEISQAISLAKDAKQKLVPFVFLVAGRSTLSSEDTVEPTIDLEVVNVYCKEEALLFWSMTAEKRINSVYAHNEQQMHDFRTLLKSLLVKQKVDASNSVGRMEIREQKLRDVRRK